LIVEDLFVDTAALVLPALERSASRLRVVDSSLTAVSI